MNQIKQKTKQNKKYDIVVVVAVLATGAMIFAVGTSYMISVRDALAKNRHVLDLPLKTKECKHDTTEGPSCKDDSNSSTVLYDPNRCIPGNECPPECPEGWVPATPPLNPQLGCLPDTEIADLSHSSSGDDDDDRIGCPEGSVPATPPLNPQLGCISGTVAAEPEAQLEDSEDVQSDDETDNVKDGEDHRSESLVLPLDQTSLEDEEEDNEEDEKDENNSDEVGNDKDGNNNGVR